MNVTKIVAAILSFTAVMTAGLSYAANPLDAYSKAVKDAYVKSYYKLDFPSGVDNTYKAKAAGMLMGCLDDCINKTGKIASIQTMRVQNCQPMCECMANGLMIAFGSEFTQKNQSPAIQAKGHEAAQTCISKYKDQ